MKYDWHLSEFALVQEPVYQQVVSELSQGLKRSHWMWFIFPQIIGLGRSAISRQYGIKSVEEATAYWQHDLLGMRLKECTELVLAHRQKTIDHIFSYPDDLKFHSCMTLFFEATQDAVFKRALSLFFAGGEDRNTLELL